MKKYSASVAEPGRADGMRTRFRLESNCQIVHDSLYIRPGWTTTYLLSVDETIAGYGSIAQEGPWKDRPTIFEFYLLPDFRVQAFRLFEVFLETCGAKYFEVQSNHSLLAAMLFRYAENIRSEAMVFYDHHRTSLTVPGATLECQTDAKEIQSAIDRRRGGGKWSLLVDSEPVGSGGILFHYNYPYADIYMEINEGHRRHGYGAFLVQEFKRIAYEFGAVPAARCNPENIASQLTLQKAGFAPYAHILDGDLKTT